jgi:predicted RNA-binding protein YlxR (DUF448 family)
MSNAQPVTGKSTPQRTCVACRQIKTKREMVRLVRTPGGEIEIDIKGKKEGRGAYLCRDWSCWEKALKSNQLEHTLKSKLTKDNIAKLSKTGQQTLKELTSG